MDRAKDEASIIFAHDDMRLRRLALVGEHRCSRRQVRRVAAANLVTLRVLAKELTWTAPSLRPSTSARVPDESSLVG